MFTPVLNTVGRGKAYIAPPYPESHPLHAASRVVPKVKAPAPAPEPTPTPKLTAKAMRAAAKKVWTFPLTSSVFLTCITFLGW